MKPHELLYIAIILILLIYGLCATFCTFILSLYKWYFPDPKGPIFIGFQNYFKLLSDVRLANALRNSTAFASMAVSIEFVAGLGLSLYLYERLTFKPRLYNLVIIAFIVPMIISPIIGGILLVVFKANLHRFLIVRGIDFNIYSGGTALPLLALLDAWQWTPFIFLIFTAKLQSLPVELSESAKVDGASWWLAFRKVILPMLMPTMVTVLVLRSIDAFKVLDLIFITQGGPVWETETVNFYIFKMVFVFSEIGYGAALTSFLTLIVQLPIVLWLSYSALKRGIKF